MDIPGRPLDTPPPPGEDPAHVLLVEDVSVTREFLAQLLRGCGHRVTSIGTVAEALALLDQELPDLVVLDLLLPDRNGLEACRDLRARPGGEDIPVLIITMDERPDSHEAALKAGADDLLRKPLLAMEMKSRVSSLLRLRRLRGALRREHEALLNLQGQRNQLIQFLVHDLRNMLTTLLCNVELLEPEAGLPPAVPRERIRATALGMHGMVQNMLDLSMHEQSALHPHWERREAAPWMEELRPELESMLRWRHQNLQIQVDPELWASADFQMIRRVLLNLLANASKHGPAGREIHVAFQARGAAFRIQVADQGTGIPDGKKALIFDRFTRLGTPGDGEGRGLGLAFCRMVMDLHGGRIWVEDNAPTGSRFILEWPTPPEAP